MEPATQGECRMKKVGMIGGIGPESTIDYYRQLIAAYRAQHPDGSYPPIVINSVNLKALVDHGFLKPDGEKRGRAYVAAPILHEIRERTREPRAPKDPLVL